MLRYMIMKLFSPFGKIAREDFFWHMQGEKRGTPRGYCFVEFEKKEVHRHTHIQADANHLLHHCINPIDSMPVDADG